MDTASLSIVCPQCSRNYRWKPEFAGRRAKCKCGGTVEFPRNDPAAGAVSQELDMAAPPVAPVPPIAAASAAPTCPVCKNAVDAKAVLCTRCGTNLKSGKQLTTKVKGPGMEAGDVAVVAGRMMLTMIVGFVAAILGAGIWLTIMIVTGYSIGIVAWLIGALVGLAVGLINRQGGTLVGLTGAGFALLAVLLPKGLLCLLLLLQHHSIFGVFRPFDALWGFLALSSAYKLASGNFERE